MVDLMLDDACLEACRFNRLRLFFLAIVDYPDRSGPGHYSDPIRHGETPLTPQRLTLGIGNMRIGHIEQAVILAGPLALPAINHDKPQIFANLRRGNTDTAGTSQHGCFQLFAKFNEFRAEMLNSLRLAAQALVGVPQNLNGGLIQQAQRTESSSSCTSISTPMRSATAASAGCMA